MSYFNCIVIISLMDMNQFCSAANDYFPTDFQLQIISSSPFLIFELRVEFNDRRMFGADNCNLFLNSSWVSGEFQN